MSKYYDTRDLDKRLDELEAERQDILDRIEELTEERTELEPGSDDHHDKGMEIFATNDELAEWDEENGEELKELQTMRDEISEWSHGETLIPRDCFVDYVRELCEDCGYIPKDFPDWIEIDWERTADNVEADYCEVTYLGDAYLVRS